MNKNVFYFKKINSIGGVESFYYYLSKLYDDFIIYYKEADPEQVKRLAERVEVRKFKEEPIECERFFCNYAYDIDGYVNAKEYYYIIHYDSVASGLKPTLYDGFKYIAVSKLAQKSFETTMGIKPELIYNPVVVEKRPFEKYNDGKIHILCATRLSKEKGGENIIKLAQMSEDFIIDVYSNRRLYRIPPNIILHEPKLDLTEEMTRADYVAQLSRYEAFGLTPCESLMLGTPVIVTDLEAFKEIGCKHGENAIICDKEMKNVDVEMIKKGLPEFTYTPPKSNWGKYLSKTGKYDPNKKVKVRTLKRYTDIEIGHLDRGNIATMRIARASYLEAKGLVERI